MTSTADLSTDHPLYGKTRAELAREIIGIKTDIARFDAEIEYGDEQQRAAFAVARRAAANLLDQAARLHREAVDRPMLHLTFAVTFDVPCAEWATEYGLTDAEVLSDFRHAVTDEVIREAFINTSHPVGYLARRIAVTDVEVTKR